MVIWLKRHRHLKQPMRSWHLVALLSMFWKCFKIDMIEYMRWLIINNTKVCFLIMLAPMAKGGAQAPGAPSLDTPLGVDLDKCTNLQNGLNHRCNNNRATLGSHHQHQSVESSKHLHFFLLQIWRRKLCLLWVHQRNIGLLHFSWETTKVFSAK